MIRPTMFSRLILAGFLLAIALPAHAQQGSQRVRVFRVGGVPQAQEVVGLGTVRCAKSLELGFFERGIIKEVRVEEGDHIKKGEILAKLEDNVIMADIAAKQAGIEIARQKMDRLADKMAGKKELWNRRSISEHEYKDAKHQFNQAKIELKQVKAELKGLQARLADMVLKAPVSGTVARRYVEPGEVVGQGENKVIKLVSCSTVLAEASFGEKLYLRIKPGMPVVIRADALPGREFIGKVHSISPEINDKDRTFTVKVKTPNPSLILRPGMFVRASLLKGKKGEPVWIPQSAILAELKGYGSVKVVRDSKVTLLKVKLGRKKDNMVQITEGLEPGHLVLLPQPGAKQ